MKHTMEARGNVLVITLEGEFHKDAPDYFEGIENREPLLQPWTFRQFERIVFDLSKVRTMSSNGIGILIIVRRMAIKFGHNGPIPIIIAGSNKSVEKVLVNTQIASMFELFDTVEQALGVSQ
ncbi:MAG: STAS domain-containing protein [Patescibacteria group bacterium]|jgi:anti-anti-sigma factor